MQNTASPEIKALSVVHFALFLGQLLFGFIALFLVYSGKFFSAQLEDHLQIFVVICVITGGLSYMAGTFLFRQRLEQINSGYKLLPQKLNEYRAASITRWALMEFAVVFNIMIFMLTSSYVVICIAGALIFMFTTFRPTTERIANDLNIREAELGQINKRIFF